MEKIEYIKKLEEGGETYSLINLLSIPKEIEQYLNKIKSTIVYSVGDLNYPDIKINYTEKIYKTAQGFYIYLSLCPHNNFIFILILYLFSFKVSVK